MDLVTSFVVYLLAYRMAIIGAGVVSVVLGYRLFLQGVWPGSGSAPASDLEARVAGHQLTFRNAAPGTCFALFGAVIITTISCRAARR
jgi:hypothetical protein